MLARVRVLQDVLVVIRNSTVGPHVSLGDNSVVENSIITNSIIRDGARIHGSNVKNSMIGVAAEVTASGNSTLELSISDYSTIRI